MNIKTGRKMKTTETRTRSIPSRRDLAYQNYILLLTFLTNMVNILTILETILTILLTFPIIMVTILTILVTFLIIQVTILMIVLIILTILSLS